MPTALSNLLPTIAGELNNALKASSSSAAYSFLYQLPTSPEQRRQRQTSGGGEGGSREGADGLFFFEFIDRLRDEVQHAKEQTAAQVQCVREAEQRVAERDEVIMQTESKLAASEQRVQQTVAKVSALEGQLSAAKKELERAAEERLALEQNLAQAAEELAGKDDKISEAQLEAYVEGRKVIEQQDIYREARYEAKVAAASALFDLQGVQSMLMRAHQASLRAAGDAADMMELDQLAVDQQVKRAMAWAHELTEVKGENYFASKAALVELAGRRSPMRARPQAGFGNTPPGSFQGSFREARRGASLSGQGTYQGSFKNSPQGSFKRR
jgi:hypothetical protein